MAEAIVSTLSEKLSSLLADKIFQELSLVINFREDVEFICDQLDSFKTVLNDMREMTKSSSTTNWLNKVQDFLYSAMDIVEECEPHKFRNPFFRWLMGRRIRALKKSISDIHLGAKCLKYLKTVVYVNANFQALNANLEFRSKKSSPLLTESTTVGIKKQVEMITQRILEMSSSVIAVVGNGGTGKTLVLQKVLNNQTVRQHFDHVVWLAVSQRYIVKDLLVEMCRQIEVPNGQDPSGLTVETLRDKIHELLVRDSCLLVLDDVWDRDALEQIGLRWQRGINKIVVSTRDKRVRDAMMAYHTSEMKYLTPEQSLQLFYVHAFPNRQNDPPSEQMALVSKRIVEKCDGLPLAIKTIAASLARVERIPNIWESTLQRLNQAEALVGTVTPSLRLSYDALPYNLKSCFLYCSVFCKNTEMRAQYLVYSWIAEGFVSTPTAAEAYDIGLSYIQELADRCLLDVSQVGGDGRIKYCKIHALLHDLALSESRAGTKCLLRPGEKLEKFPANECVGVRRISLVKNNIKIIEDGIQCPQLRTLLLWNNIPLKSISTSFFDKLTCLAALDLSQTSVESLPRSISKLRHLKLLNLSRTNIVKLPSCLSGLRHLQFLDVSWCRRLTALHSGIGKNKFMLHLNVKRCKELKSLPAGIAKLSSLQTLKGAVFRMEKAANVLQLAHLKKLILLQHLSFAIEDPSSSHRIIEEGTFEGMTKLRTISLRSISSCRLDLPDDMDLIAQRLEHVRLHSCSVPKWIFHLENLMVLVLDGNISGADYKGLEKISNLRELRLSGNRECVAFPEEFGASTAFPNLKKLMIEDFNSLRQFPVLQNNAMPKLQYLRIKKCNRAIDIQGFVKLKTLKEVEVEEEDLGLSQSLKDRHVNIRVINPFGGGDRREGDH